MRNPTRNFYNAAAQVGLHVLALAYESSLVVGVTCSNDGPCFELVRRSIVEGVPAPGAPPAVASIELDEGVIGRLDSALRLLATARPGLGWEQFFADPAAATPETRIDWSKLIAAGHSQGGGHAAFLGKLYPLRRVVQLSSTCDAVAGAPAPWTMADASWATSPASSYVGFATAGDAICPDHVLVWQAMGLDPTRELDDADTCGRAAHGGSILCPDNYERWRALFAD